MKPCPIHVGSLVRAELSRQQKSVTWLASQLGIQRANCYRILNAPSVHTAMLERLSIALHYDLFAECSQIIQSSILNFK